MKNIIFDWKRTLYNPDTKQLEVGAKELLDFFKKQGTPLILIGKGGQDMQQKVEELGVKDYFQTIVFSENGKGRELFLPHIDQKKPDETILIGDRMYSEIKHGIALKTTTIWVQAGKFAQELPTIETGNPTHIVKSLAEIAVLLGKSTP